MGCGVGGAVTRHAGGVVVSTAGGQMPVDRFKAQGGHAELFQVILAAHTVGGFADLLHSGNQQPDQYRNNGNHHQQFDEGKSVAYAAAHSKTQKSVVGTPA